MKVLDSLPEPKILKKLMRIQAALNIILCQDDWLRYHYYVQTWNDDVSMAKIDDGSGNHFIILFSSKGTIIKGFDHESELSPYAQDEHEVWPGIYEFVPHGLLSLLDDEAVEKNDVTFCVWHEHNDVRWQTGKVKIPKEADDGFGFFLNTICHTPKDFVEFAEDYFEITPLMDIVEKIYKHFPITVEMIRLLNPESDSEEVLRELESSGLLSTEDL
ncbi:hypothetical protein [Paenibacillus sp.]|uniref:hypothetical protein n=1 Tax=Paenibacillus sp. TaxID=58172 RepID=UPI0028241FFF|nr:hypothetical protein [Paenibacillus sp.]MDR0270579.1 hypothetical protein [Paenibacillus sp.]